MHYSRYRVSDYIELSMRVVQAATVDSSIRESMAKAGFSKERLQEGEFFFKQLASLESQHIEKTALRKAVNSDRSEIFNGLKKSYMKYVKIARIAFQDHAAIRVALLLDGQRARTVEELCDQIKIFGENLLAHEEALRSIESFGIERSAVVSLLGELGRYDIQTDLKSKLDEEIRMLTSQKKEAMLHFQKWLSGYIKIAKIKFENDPDKLKILGVG